MDMVKIREWLLETWADAPCQGGESVSLDFVDESKKELDTKTDEEILEIIEECGMTPEEVLEEMS